jgi:hypothetical protein
VVEYNAERKEHGVLAEAAAICRNFIDMHRVSCHPLNVAWECGLSDQQG